MFALIARVARFLNPRNRAADGGALPRRLLESAGARAGRDPLQAQELRGAAYAAMRVVR